MQKIKFRQRQKELLNYFTSGKNASSPENQIIIKRLKFDSKGLSDLVSDQDTYIRRDVAIKENSSFYYPVFMPSGALKYRSFILLLHGLNERKWDKYLYWAEYITLKTGKPVILFPIAFHINRSPSWWTDPRLIRSLINKRIMGTNNNRSMSFVNASLSERLTEEPARFYSSGYQTIQDITSLIRQIRSGMHPLLTDDASADIFAYSIGSFLAEIILMADPFNLFSTSRLFVFCGGAIFSDMYGESKYIMDKTAYERLYSYYCFEWLTDEKNKFRNGEKLHDIIIQAFNAMIRPDKYKEERAAFFNKSKNRISGINLLKDKVMPWSGIKACMGSKMAEERFILMDFPYNYTHESPFPSNSDIDDDILNSSFRAVFQKSVEFLA
ncbi:MAG: DUF6051 family protein [Prolixibacteraceae bacterium]|nr:DUF6051 family protein [Prolixibacteraceae bacterium]